MRVMFVSLLSLVTLAAMAEESWKLPLAIKEAAIEQNIINRHDIMGLYPSQVRVPLDGGPVDYSTLGYANVAHSVCWTANYLAGVSYRYAFLKKSGAGKEVVSKARARADVLFEAVYRCQLVTGIRGMQARGYVIGHGESYEERWDESWKNDWHQGAGKYANLRWRGDPSHHNYSDAIHGFGQYYDLVAEGGQKERCREAIDALVSYWVDNDLKIYKFDRSRPPVPILGLTDGKTPNTRIIMALAGAKVALHATGKRKFKTVYDRLIEQYGIRNLKAFKAEKDFDDAEHVFCHLENLFRIEDDPEILAGYRTVLEALWANHKNDAQSLFTYIYLGLSPNASDRARSLKEALVSLRTWPTDTTLRPRMNSIAKDLRPPYPVYAAAWDNEYMWKGNLLTPDGWLSRTVTDIAVSREDPMVIYAVDERGDLYQSRDGAATAAGWRPIDQGLPTPVRAIDAGPKARMVFAACREGFYMTVTGGYTWQRMPVPRDGGRPVDIVVDTINPHVVYAITDRGIYRSEDFGEKFMGKSWQILSDRLPRLPGISFTVAPGDPGLIYAVIDDVVFTRRLDQDTWRRGGTIGLGRLGQAYPWLIVDPSHPGRALAGVKTTSLAAKTMSLLQETTDAGATWTNDRNTVAEKYAAGSLHELLALQIDGQITAPTIDPRNPMILYAGSNRGFLKSLDAGKTWQVKNTGLDIPIARAVFAPANTDRIFAGTPAGLFISEDGGETWQDGHLCLQFHKNARREIGGAAYIDAYWRARYYGFIDDATVNASWPEK